MVNVNLKGSWGLVKIRIVGGGGKRTMAARKRRGGFPRKER